MKKKLSKTDDLSRCPKCGAPTQTRPGWPGHSEDVVPCRCKCGDAKK